ncbi:MAG TPA: tetratricopeptide repeat protein, partial [Terracidiphilus sp.]|nr:tetratricopeptide repeat protein [Terracidiphilus sp.]
MAVILACCWAGSLRLHAQAPQNGQAPAAPQDKQAAPPAQKTAPKPAAGSSSNPFPDDTNSVPVVPTSNAPAAPTPDADYGNVPLPSDASDPVRSPDDTAVEAPRGADSGSSSSSAGLDDLLKPPPDTRKEKGEKAEAAPKEGPKVDENVGSYYLESKNWKGALSRFESALVLDPENPEVYWGLAEAQRHLGQFAEAKANYLKVMEYDPDSRHS